MFSILSASHLSRGERQEALQFLFAAADNSETRIDLILAALESGELDPAGLLICRDKERYLGVLMVEVLPGNSASLWPICSWPGPQRIVVEDGLLARAMELLRERHIKVAQTLLSPNDEITGTALVRNGFERVTQMWRMDCAASDPDLPSIKVIHFDALGAKDPIPFRDVLVGTFEGSLDFPELNGLRSADEILAGHMAGAPDLSRW